MSTKNFRIKSAGGRWAVGDYYQGAIVQDPWICEQMVELWRSAAQAAAAGECKELRAAVELAGRIGYGEEPDTVILPATVDSLRRAEADVQAQKAAFMERCKERGGHYGYGNRSPDSEWRERERSIRERASIDAREVESRFVPAPSVTWAAVPGGASLFEPAAAVRAIEWAKECVALRSLMPKARTQAAKLGFGEPSWMKPKMENLGVGPKDLAKSVAEAFDAGSEFSDKVAYAIYADDTGQEGEKGFANKKGDLRNDIAEACLFPTKKAALSFARGHVGSDCHAVTVVVSALSYEPLVGNPGPANDLAAVIAARERAELEKVLASARVEELEAELARRRESTSEAEIAPAEPARRSRL